LADGNLSALDFVFRKKKVESRSACHSTLCMISAATLFPASSNSRGIKNLSPELGVVDPKDI
jgi:hypothetical protein